MSDTATVDQDELATDAQFQDTLERVSFQPGILLGSEALNAEQAYHLRRLTRHQRWLIGPGTVFGLRVDTTLPLSALAWTGGTVTATTAEDTRLLRIGRDDFYDLLSDNSEITSAIFSTLVKRFRKLVEQ